jgi:hypothetical protein
MPRLVRWARGERSAPRAGFCPLMVMNLATHGLPLAAVRPFIRRVRGGKLLWPSLVMGDVTRSNKIDQPIWDQSATNGPKSGN